MFEITIYMYFLSADLFIGNQKFKVIYNKTSLPFIFKQLRFISKYWCRQWYVGKANILRNRSTVPNDAGVVRRYREHLLLQPFWQVQGKGKKGKGKNG